MVIPGGARWLKEFFEEGLTLTNNAEAGTPFGVTDAKVTLKLPDGLTFMPTNYSKSLIVEMEKLLAGETKEIKWVIRGDRKGYYNRDTLIN